MPQITEASAKLQPAQATALSLLVDLEARWENMRRILPMELNARATKENLKAKQKAYEAFRAKLVAYNNCYAPAHVPELLLNTPIRLGIWCRKMLDLFHQVEHDPQSCCPVNVVEKACRSADQICVRVNKELMSRSAPPVSIADAIRDLEALAQWCDDQ